MAIAHSDMIDRARQKAGIPLTSPSRFDDARTAEILTDAMLTLVVPEITGVRQDYFQTAATTNVTDGSVRTYPLPAGATAGAIEKVTYDDVPMVRWNLASIDWDEPEVDLWGAFRLEGMDLVLLFNPEVGKQLKFWYEATPADITTTGNFTSLPEIFARPLEWLAASEIASALGDSEREDRLFLGGMRRLQQVLKHIVPRVGDQSEVLVENEDFGHAQGLGVRLPNGVWI